MLLTGWVAVSDAADAARGKVVAQVRCLPCHHLESHSRSIGPGLLGVFGRAPSIEGVPFDVWDEVTLDAWLRNPRLVKPNPRMALPPIADRDRADIIAWFRSVAAESKSFTAKEQAPAFPARDSQRQVNH